MSRIGRTVLALAPALVLAIVLSSPVAAAPAWVGHYYFHDCTGPAPSSFTALKEQTSDNSRNGVSAATSFRLEDGSVFVVKSFDGSTIGKGISANDLVVSCVFDSIEFGPVVFSGFIAPR